MAGPGGFARFAHMPTDLWYDRRYFPCGLDTGAVNIRSKQTALPFAPPHDMTLQILSKAIAAGVAMDDVAARIAANFPEVEPTQSWGETSFFYNPGGALPRGVYFCTLKDHDGENDRASGLDRSGVYRLNFGPPVSAFEKLFGPRPARPKKGGVVNGPWDFTALDVLTPHPVYGWMGWIAVLNPTEATLAETLPLLSQAYEKAQKTFAKRRKGA